jgi:ABC-type antimicrobial peptide transport system permease subunit
MLTSDDPSDRNCVTIVGVVPGFFKRGILDRDQYVVYRPLAQGDAHRPAAMFIAVQGEMTTVVPAVRRAFQSARTDLPAVSVERMRDVLEPEMKPWRLAATMFTAFGSIALIIAVVGLYGVVATNATLRSMELAVRIALGAQEKHILVAVAGDGLRSVAVGLAIGSGAALVIGRWLGGMLYETSASDPAIILGVAALLFSVAVIACLVPTWRVLRTGPAIVLRSE